MATTRFGLGGPSAAYAGFSAKAEAALTGAVVDLSAFGDTVIALDAYGGTAIDLDSYGMTVIDTDAYPGD